MKFKGIELTVWGICWIPELQPRMRIWWLCGCLTYDDPAQRVCGLADGAFAQSAILVGACWAVANIQIHHICDGCVNLLPALIVISGLADWSWSARPREHVHQIPI